MVEGIHVAAPEIAVFHLAVPVLPDRGGALCDRIEPGRIFAAQEQIVGQFRIAVRGQRVQQVRCSDKAGLELRAAAADHLCQLVCRLLRVLRKRKIDGERAFRLRLIDRICLTERTDDAFV